jgi:hypothetical protein
MRGLRDEFMDRVALLERVPVLDCALREEGLKGTGGAVMESETGDVFAAEEQAEVPAESVAAADDILGLMFGGDMSSAPSTAVTSSKATNVCLGALILGYHGFVW